MKSLFFSGSLSTLELTKIKPIKKRLINQYYLYFSKWEYYYYYWENFLFFSFLIKGLYVITNSTKCFINFNFATDHTFYYFKTGDTFYLILHWTLQISLEIPKHVSFICEWLWKFPGQGGIHVFPYKETRKTISVFKCIAYSLL